MVIPHHLILSGLLASQVAATTLLTRRNAQGVSTAFTDLAPIPPGLIDAAHHRDTLRHACALLDAEDGHYTALCALDSWRPTLLERELLESQVVISNGVLDMPELLDRIRANRSAHGAATRHYGAMPLTVRQLPTHTDSTELACESLGHPILPGMRLVSERFPEPYIAAACVQEDQGTAGEFFLEASQLLLRSIIVPDEKVQQAGNRFTLPDGRQIAVWLLPELIDDRVEGQETYSDISWEEAAALGVTLNEYLETEINER